QVDGQVPLGDVQVRPADASGEDPHEQLAPPRLRNVAFGPHQRPRRDRGRRPHLPRAHDGQGASGSSNQTALPSAVGRAPHRLASWSTRYRPRPPSSVSPALRMRGRRMSESNTSTQMASAPRRRRSRNSFVGGSRRPSSAPRFQSSSANAPPSSDSPPTGPES